MPVTDSGVLPPREHIYRTHLKRLVCPRCADKFSTDQALEVHLRADDMCKKKDFVSLDGIDREQEKKLRARPKKDNTTPEEKWTSIYRIIFPDTPKDSIPSPCKSPVSSSAEERLLTLILKDCDDQQSQSLDGMHEFVRRGLPWVARRKVEEAIERYTNDTEKKMTSTIMRILPQLTEQLIEVYRGEKDRSDDEPLAPMPSIAAAGNEVPAVLDDRLFLGLDEDADYQYNCEDFTNEFDFPAESVDGIYYAVAGLGDSMPSS